VSALIQAELLKMRTVRTTPWLLVLTAALTAAIAIVSVLQIVLGDLTYSGNEPLRSVIGGVGTAGGHLVMLCLGIMSLGGEFRHNTITPTLLAEPRRPRVVAAKLAGVSLVGLLFAVVAVAVAVAIAAPWLAGTGYPVSFADGEFWLQVLGNVLVLVLYGLMGFGLGVLIRNQVVAILLAVIWVFLLEGILSAVSARWFSWLAPWLPGSAAASLQRTFVPAGTEGAEFIPDYLPMWGGGLVLLAYALLFTAAGTAFVLNRDVT
jgi:ABC-2 type transport system permease protein